MNEQIAENNFNQAVEKFNDVVLQINDNIVASTMAMDQDVESLICPEAKMAISRTFTAYINRSRYLRSSLESAYEDCRNAYATYYGVSSQRMQGEVFMKYNKVKADYDFAVNNQASCVRDLGVANNSIINSIEMGDEE